MNSQALKQNLVYLGVALFVWLIIYVIKPSYPFQPTGIILPAIKAPLIPSNQPVKVFEIAPYGSTLLANIHLEAHSLKPNKSQELEMLNTAKKMAQQAGADGLVINSFGYEGTAPGNPAVLTKYVLFAKAVKLN